MKTTKSFRIVIGVVGTQELACAAALKAAHPDSSIEIWPIGGPTPESEAEADNKGGIILVGAPPEMSYIGPGQPNDFMGLECSVVSWMKDLVERDVRIAGLVQPEFGHRFAALARELGLEASKMDFPSDQLMRPDIEDPAAKAWNRNVFLRQLNKYRPFAETEVTGAIAHELLPVAAGVQKHWIDLALDGIDFDDLDEHTEALLRIVESMAVDRNPSSEAREWIRQARVWQAAAFQVFDEAEYYPRGIRVVNWASVEKPPGATPLVGLLRQSGARVVVEVRKDCTIVQSLHNAIDLSVLFTDEESRTPAVGRRGKRLATDVLELEATAVIDRLLAHIAF